MRLNCKLRGYVWVALVWLVGVASASALPALELTEHDRILVLAPHPDDEVLGCSGIIQQAVEHQLPLRIVFLTYGDNNEWSFLWYRKRPVLWPGSVRKMGMVRHDEAVAAAKVMGVGAEQLTFLGYPDFGTLAIWRAHWGDRPPYRGMLTRAKAVPYQNAFRPGAEYRGEEVVKDLTAILREFRPTKIFVSHPADHNGDHRALYLFTRIALWDLERELQPQVYPYLIHFPRWPRPRGARPDESLAPPKSLRDQLNWQINPLTTAQTDVKRRALMKHRTQYAYSGKYLSSFIRANELFGDFASVFLRGSAPDVALVPTSPEAGPEMSEELTEEEQAAFVGVEQNVVRVENADLVVAIKFTRPLAKEVQASVFLFGYRPDRPFAEMPKLQIKIGELSNTVYDQDRRLMRTTLKITQKTREITIRVPLEALGNPQRVLTSARTYMADLPLDWAAWRLVNLPVAP